MFAAALRGWRWWRALALFAAAVGIGRAAPLTLTRYRGVDYASMIDVCGRLGLRLAVSGNGHTMTVANPAHRGILLPPGRINAREIIVDGVRIFLGDAVLERGGQFFVSRVDFEKRLLPIFRPDLIRPLVRAPRVIVIDPGHGGVDPGAENRRFHLQEKRLTLDVAERLERLLQAQGWTVILTRTRDTQLSVDKVRDLPMRADLANRSQADLFLSIHFDAADDPRTRGSEVLMYAPVGQRSTDSWGTRQDDHLAEVQPGDHGIPWSNVLAHAVSQSLHRSLRTEDLGERIRHLAVLRYLNCPGILVEPVFITNDAEAVRAADPAFRQQVAEGLAAGLRDYAAQLAALNPAPPSAGWTAPRRS